MAAFTARLRRTIDLDTVQGDLVRVVHEAFQPAHVSVWLPGAKRDATVPAPRPAPASLTAGERPSSRETAACPAPLRRRPARPGAQPGRLITESNSCSGRTIPLSDG